MRGVELGVAVHAASSLLAALVENDTRRAPPCRSGRNAPRGNSPSSSASVMPRASAHVDPSAASSSSMWSRWVAGQYTRAAARAALEPRPGSRARTAAPSAATASRATVHQRRVAVEAAVQEPGPRAARGRHLPELLAEVVAGDEEMRRQIGVAHQAGVARQQQAMLAAGTLRQRPAAQVRAVGDVVAEDAQPAGKPAEHLVDRERRAQPSGSAMPSRLYGGRYPLCNFPWLRRRQADRGRRNGSRSPRAATIRPRSAGPGSLHRPAPGPRTRPGG